MVRMRISRPLSRLRDTRALMRLRKVREYRRRVPWPVDAAGSPTGDQVGIVVVNHDTRELVSQLVFSLYRILGGDQFGALVVVDNGSHDGSVESLEALDRAGLLHLIANRRGGYHGPGLNQAISWLAQRQAGAAPQDRIDYVWVLDSDTIVLRRDTIRDALEVFGTTGAAMLGQEFDRAPGYAKLALHSLMLQPAEVWQRRFPPFMDDGSPEQAMQHAVLAAGLRVESFPFLHHSYVLHLGGGTMRELARVHDWRNRFYGYAVDHHERHYNHHPLGPRLHQAVVDIYSREVTPDTPAGLAEACRRKDLYSIPDAEPLPPLAELRELQAQGADLVEYLDRRAVARRSSQ
jgi:hypothetical protein